MLLDGSLRDLDVAQEAILRMERANTLTEFQYGWQDFLFRIERAWETAERVLRAKPGFQQWFKPYAALRKKDPLLRFLRQARNAETHGISDTVGKPLQLQFQDKYGRPFDFKGAAANLDVGTGTLTINIDSQHRAEDFNVSVVPTNPALVRFKNRGTWYNPPTTHLGNRLTDSHPVSAAKCGIAFYRTFIKESSARFP